MTRLAATISQLGMAPPTESSRNVIISDSYIETGDDAICLKSHKLPVENIAVTNNVLISDDSAIKIGTGTYSGIRNCVF